jgi:transcriptional regulator with XRE-family HTH domain
MVTEVHKYKDEEGFDLRLEARLKNAALVGAREELGLTARAAAEAIGISYPYYIGIEGMKSYPSQESQEKICNFYRSQGIFIFEEDVFPNELRRAKPRKMVTEAVIPRSNLIGLTEASHRHLLPPVSMEGEIEAREMKDAVEELLQRARAKFESYKGMSRPSEGITEREEQIVRMYLGFDGEEKTFGQIGDIFNMSLERIRQLFYKSIGRLRQLADPELENYLDGLR